MALTLNQILGKKFEIYIYQLFLDLGKKVEMNIYQRIQKQKVQIDLKVNYVFSAKIYELKYTKSKVGLYYGNPVEQLLRTARLTGYHPGGIITNGGYIKPLKEYAAQRKVRLYDIEDLLNWENERSSLDGFGLIDPLSWFKNKEKKIHRINKKIENIIIENYSN